MAGSQSLWIFILSLSSWNIQNARLKVLHLLKFNTELFFFLNQGAVQGPEEFAEGLVIGVRSLFGHTVGWYDQCVSAYVITALKCIVYGKQVVICSKREFTFLINF